MNAEGIILLSWCVALNALSGVKYLGALVLSEWMNLVMKW